MLLWGICGFIKAFCIYLSLYNFLLHQVRDEGLNIAFQESSIHLPPGAFSSSNYSRVVTLVYLTLNDVLLLSNENEDDDEYTLSANTTIISSTVDPKPPDVLNKPVKVVLEHKKVLV